MLSTYMLLLVIIYVECIYVDGEIFYMRFGVVMLVKACIGICWCGLVKLHEACLLLSSPSSHTLLLLSFISNCCCWILRYSLCGLLCGLLWCFCCIRGDGLGDERKLVPHVLELSRHIVCSRKSRVLFWTWHEYVLVYFGVLEDCCNWKLYLCIQWWIWSCLCLFLQDITPSGLWWTAYLFVWMGRRRAGLVIALLLVSARGSRASSFYVARRVLEALI